MRRDQIRALSGSGAFGRHEHDTDKVLARSAGSKLRVQQHRTITNGTPLLHLSFRVRDVSEIHLTRIGQARHLTYRTRLAASSDLVEALMSQLRATYRANSVLILRYAENTRRHIRPSVLSRLVLEADPVLLTLVVSSPV